MLVIQVYPVCVIGPLTLKQAQLVPQVLKLSWIDPFTNSINGVAYMTNGIMSWLFFNDVACF